MKNNFRYVVITGASTGIGKVTAIMLAQQGYYVFAGVRNEQDAQRISTEASNIHPVILDVAKPEHIESLFALASSICKDSGLYALINNAGINYIDPFENTKEENARYLMEVNFFGMYKMMQTFLPLLRKAAGSNNAKIINLSSIGGAIGLPWESFYHASKFAVIGLSESLRFEFRKQNIAVSCILPGGIKTDFMTKLKSDVNKSLANLTPANPPYYKKGLVTMIKASEQFGEKMASKPGKVAATIVKILNKRRPRFKFVVGTDGKMMYWMSKFLPSTDRHFLLRRQFGA
ncbi:hypothetical protein A9P82_01515 [Arachidicoccus ginsenosidimutans]|uniref:SDR family NAD(P)-dependent oxidoreductase n=1 Tax=Arachidicoccus sp. BS20 TaxID=1850526 RepID=UPI0007F08421|nr:SDR family NAD(P)-dependent oxidoreductase [Arachidicoccus sp. BS20]ANI88104.1 hypothetical protein A9P82_01515 [Arachidicoccus sp. BS20]